MASKILPFDLNETHSYQQWREWKRSWYPVTVEDLLVPLVDPYSLSAEEKTAILDRCLKYNLAIYSCGQVKHDISDKNLSRTLSKQLGLTRLDAHLCTDEDDISSLKVASSGKRHQGYIPYTNRAINWHTDGYYNVISKQIHALNLHVVQQAASGGENSVMDHEIAYIRLRQENPDYIRALMEPDVMMIPANISKEGELIRPDRYGPVFSILPDGNLHMRYTARTRSIEWKQDPVVEQAITLLHDYLHTDSPYIYRGTLQSGQGLISNNVLHDRAAFTDDDEHKRHYYRARYFDRIANT